MSDQLLWVEVPPPRVAREAKLTLALSMTLAIYAVPVVTAADPEAALPVDLDDTVYCCFCSHAEPVPEPEDEELVIDTHCNAFPTVAVDPPLSREQAIEQALSNYVGVLGSSELFRPSPSLTPRTFAEELGLDDSERWWRPSRTIQPRQLSTFSVLAQGALDRRTVHRYLERQQLELARCVDPTPSLQLGRALRGDGDPAMQFLIDRDGRVVQVLPITSSPELAACLEQTVKTFTFPRSDGLTQVHVPLRYGTTDASAGAFVRKVASM